MEIEFLFYKWSLSIIAGIASYDETLFYFNGLFIIEGIYYFFGGRPRFFFNLTDTPLSIYDAEAGNDGE
jgi:hypothetical protein